MNVNVDRFQRDGFLAIPSFASEAELAMIRAACDDLLSRVVVAEGDRRLGDVIRQIVLPSRAHATFAANPVLDRALATAKRLLGKPNATRVFDQIIHKPAGDPNITPWHQDHAYLGEPFAPAGSAVASYAAMFWIALDDVDLDNSCMQFMPSHHDRPLLEHEVVSGKPTDDSRLLGIVDAASRLDVGRAIPVPLRAGGCTVHLPRTPHMTGPNTSADRDRRAYIIAIAAF